LKELSPGALKVQLAATFGLVKEKLEPSLFTGLWVPVDSDMGPDVALAMELCVALKCEEEFAITLQKSENTGSFDRPLYTRSFV
jgi:hypothetical protein